MNKKYKQLFWLGISLAIIMFGIGILAKDLGTKVLFIFGGTYWGLAFCISRWIDKK